ncbi:hypothetical protein DSM112329_01821 [Paraconexibacter sp. AEG42_29]|uniref:Uncharacterized protein n=1 Tax=Paraconexibacter sp. AEG42_29 TaxID=2997339 RepID=A0AAU7ATF3_9ACTN
MAAFELARRTGAAPRTRSRRARRTYDREQILDAIRRWDAEQGHPPTWLDWDPACARRKGHAEQAERFEAGTWPTTAMVRRQFPTLGSAIEAAGLVPPKPRGTKANLVDGEQVLLAIREWTRRYGDPPAQTDLDPYRARRTGQPWRADRYLAGDWPSLPTVRHHYGTLTSAVRAAGLEPRPQTEAVTDRVQRRRRNRLALVDQLSHADASPGPKALADAVRGVAAARASGDQDDLENALLLLAGAALGWADGVGHARA